MEQAQIKVFQEGSPEQVIEEVFFGGEGACNVAYKYWLDSAYSHVDQARYSRCERDFDDFTLGEIILREAPY